MDTGLDAIRPVSKKVVHKAGEFLENEFADAVSKSNDSKVVKPD